MPKYTFTISGIAEIEAPNVAKANQIAKEKLRIIGEEVGTRREKHNRDLWSHAIKLMSVSYSLPTKT